MIQTLLQITGMIAPFDFLPNEINQNNPHPQVIAMQPNVRLLMNTFNTMQTKIIQFIVGLYIVGWIAGLFVYLVLTYNAFMHITYIN